MLFHPTTRTFSPTQSKSKIVSAGKTVFSCILYALVLCASDAISQSNNTTSTSPTASNLTILKYSSPAIEEVLVFGRAQSLIGDAATASEGSVSGDDLLVRPMLRIAELLEAVPGMIAAQHSGSGKANQYFLRGFNLDHGTDFTTYVDDVPLNLRTHGHGQGYLDVNGLIPEIVERVDFRKGTYRASSGDFSMAGSANMITIDELSNSFLALEAGSYDWTRVAAGGSTELNNGKLTIIGQYKTYNGPWQLPEDLHHQSMWAKYSKLTEYGSWKISLSGYKAQWNPTEQTPESALDSEACKNKYCSLDPSAFGETDRWILTSNWQGEDWMTTLYGQFYDWQMLSNPTYTDDGQINQFDRRDIMGGRYEKNLFKLTEFSLMIGSEWRYDKIKKVGLDASKNGNPIANISNNKVDENSLGIYTEATWTPIEKFRLSGGLRTDIYELDVMANSKAGNGSTSGKDTDSISSPKLGAAFKLSEEVEVYANWGRGFHSNDARGVVNKNAPVPALVDGTGYESGIRFERDNFNLSATYWWLNLSSELTFVGDSNSVEPKEGTKRHGYELVAFWQPVSWLGIDAVFTDSNARNSSPEESGGKYVEGAVENSGEIGISATRANWELSTRLRYLGSYPLLSDNSERAGGETMLNMRLAYDYQKVTIYGELLNVLDSTGKDIVYYYENAFDPEGGRVSRAEEPRSVRAGLKFKF